MTCACYKSHASEGFNVTGVAFDVLFKSDALVFVNRVRKLDLCSHRVHFLQLVPACAIKQDASDRVCQVRELDV